MNEVQDIELVADLMALPDRAAMLEWVSIHVKQVVPYKSVCHNHDAPARFLDQVLYGRGDVMAIACRGGGKTNMEGIAAGMIARLMRGDVRVLGGSARQTQACYAAFHDFLKAGYYSDVDGDVLISRTEFMGGGKVELLAQSTTSVRSPHVPFLFLDEVDEFHPEVLSAAKFIPQSDPVKGHRQKMVMASTRHVPLGLMSNEWDNFEGTRLIWCLLEIMEPCGGDYSCSKCNLTGCCPGKSKMDMKAKQMSGYYTIDDARALRARTHDEEAWNSEALCREPRAEGAVYKMDERIHLEDIALNPLLPVDRCFDYGSANDPCVCQWWQVTNVKGRRQARLIGEQRWRGKSDAFIRAAMLSEEKRRGYGYVQKTFLPGDAASLRNEFEEHGIMCELSVMDVMDGINHVRNMLAADERGTPGIIMDRSLKVRQEGTFSTWEEIKGYKLERGRPVKENDHGCIAEGVQVLTIGGLVPIEKIKVGDEVLTRVGYRKVLDCAMTGIKDTMMLRGDGIALEATLDHEAWVEGRGWTPIDAIGYYDTMLSVRVGVGRHTGRTSIPAQSIVRVTALARGDGRKGVRVYDLTVEGEHEYFAGGLLVKNCDAIRYYVMSEPTLMMRSGMSPYGVSSVDVNP